MTNENNEYLVLQSIIDNPHSSRRQLDDNILLVKSAVQRTGEKFSIVQIKQLLVNYCEIVI